MGRRLRRDVAGRCIGNANGTPLCYIDRRVVLDDLGDPNLPGIGCIDGEERRAAAHRRDIDLGVLLEDAEIAVCAAAVAPVTGDYADLVRPDSGLDQFAERTMRGGVVIELRHDHAPCHWSMLPAAAISRTAGA